MLARWLVLGSADAPSGLLPAVAAFAQVVTLESSGDPETGDPGHQLTVLAGPAAVEEALSQARALGIADRVSTGPAPSASELPDALAAHDVLVSLATTASGVERLADALVATTAVVAARTPDTERLLTPAVDLAVAELTPAGDALGAAAAYQRLLGRAPDADWPTVQAIVAQRRAADLAPLSVLCVVVDDVGADGLLPVLDHLVVSGATVTLCSLLPEGGDRLVAAEPRLQQVPPPAVPSLLLAASRTAAGAGPGLVASLPRLAVGQVARIWTTRRPREVAAYIRQLIDERRPDIVVVDEFVSGCLTAFRPDLPFTVSVTQRARLWRHLATPTAAATAATTAGSGSTRG